MTISKFFDIWRNAELIIYRSASFNKVQIFAALTDFEGVVEHHIVNSENEIENSLDIITNRFIFTLEGKPKIWDNQKDLIKRVKED